MGGNNLPIVMESIPEKSFCIVGNTIERQVQNGGNGKGVLEEMSYTLNTTDRHAVAQPYGGGTETLAVRKSRKRKRKYLVRRLTPLECERLQGLPDGYTDIPDKTCSDSARYKALGNGMAQPCPDFIIRRITECVNEREKI